MELALIIIVVAFLAWVLGFMNSLRRAAQMANREVSKLDDKHKMKTIADYKAMEIDAEAVAKAKETKALLESFEI
jgi:hypothetical protein